MEVLTDADRALLKNFTSRMESFAGAWQNDVEAVVTKCTVALKAVVDDRNANLRQLLEAVRFQKILAKLSTLSTEPRALSPESPKRPTFTPPPRPSVAVMSNGNSQVKGGAFRSMLVALAQAGKPLVDSQLTARAGMALSGTFDKYLGQMRSDGWVVGDRSSLQITAAGLEALGNYDPLPTGRELQTYWLNKLGAGKKREMLDVLIRAYPSMLSDHEVADRAQMALSGTFDKYLGQLRSLMLVVGPRAALQASEELFG